MAETTLRLEIRGRVQGVGYRAALVDQARRLDLRGWVRNRRDGSVEAMVAGPPDAVQHLLDWSRRGPPAAIVHSVDSFAAEGRFNSFEQWPTY
ncbi:MAG: acylphosphatase [Rubrivivax sp.]|nr:acylphosphatase [Rubrivivax sp.]